MVSASQLLRLFPAAWRVRYGDEFLATTEMRRSEFATHSMLAAAPDLMQRCALRNQRLIHRAWVFSSSSTARSA